jgi:hypothetical protein
VNWITFGTMVKRLISSHVGPGSFSPYLRFPRDVGLCPDTCRDSGYHARIVMAVTTWRVALRSVNQFTLDRARAL